MPGGMLTALSTKTNGLNALRLIFAAAVLIGHSWNMSGHGSGPSLAGNDLGVFAVGGFFAISGYLITGSRLKLSLPRFAWHRFLRVYPGYWAVLTVTAFALAPFVSWIAGEHWTAGAAWHYMSVNSTTQQRHMQIDGTLLALDGPNGGPWNLPLWTLPIEVTCYVIAGLAMTVKRLRRPLAPLVALVIASVALETGELIGNTDVRQLFRLGAPFAAGAALRLLADRVPVRASWAAGAGLLCLAAAATGHLYSLAALPLAYLVLYGGARWKTTLGRTDISYGVYIYAFPIQQMLANTGTGTGSVLLFAVTTIVLVFPLALANHVLIERPALRLKGWAPALRRSNREIVDPLRRASAGRPHADTSSAGQ